MHHRLARNHMGGTIMLQGLRVHPRRFLVMRLIRCANGTLEVIGTINAPDYFAANMCFGWSDWQAGIEFPTYEQIWGCLGCRDDRQMHIWREATQHFAFLMQKEITHG